VIVVPHPAALKIRELDLALVNLGEQLVKMRFVGSERAADRGHGGSPKLGIVADLITERIGRYGTHVASRLASATSPAPAEGVHRLRAGMVKDREIRVPSYVRMW
jgi:hypothetical protein